MSNLDQRLDSHRTEMSQCRRCGHSDDIQPIVSVARAPKVMLVGQAPGKTEAAGGRPFAGRAGRTLFAWLATAGIDEATARSRIYISAVTRCYPGPSPSGRGDRVPHPDERANCAQWLERELRIIRPALIIPVGRLAIDVFLGPLPLDEVIGKEHRLTPDARRTLTHAPRTVLIPLPHPSGASSWIHARGHKRLLENALALIAGRWSALHAGRRVA
jgi:uracil-DNA glycosylase